MQLDLYTIIRYWSPVSSIVIPAYMCMLTYLPLSSAGQ